MTSKAPERACVLIAKISADTKEHLASHLTNIAWQIERGEMGSMSISGGYNSGHVLAYSESGAPTHDEYINQLHAFLDEQERAELGKNGAP